MGAPQVCASLCGMTIYVETQAYQLASHNTLVLCVFNVDSALKILDELLYKNYWEIIVQRNILFVFSFILHTWAGDWTHDSHLIRQHNTYIDYGDCTYYQFIIFNCTIKKKQKSYDSSILNYGPFFQCQNSQANNIAVIRNDSVFSEPYWKL